MAEKRLSEQVTDLRINHLLEDLDSICERIVRTGDTIGLRQLSSEIMLVLNRASKELDKDGQ